MQPNVNQIIYILFFKQGNLIEKEHLGDSDMHGRIILRWIFRKWGAGYGLDLADSG
jgi:hypothetical protein